MSLFRETLRGDKGLLLSLALPAFLAVMVLAFPLSGIVGERDVVLGTPGDHAEYRLRVTEFFPGDFYPDDTQTQSMRELLDRGAVEIRLPLSALTGGSTLGDVPGLVVLGKTGMAVCGGGSEVAAASKLPAAQADALLEAASLTLEGNVTTLDSRVRSGVLGVEYMDLDHALVVCAQSELLDRVLESVGGSNVIDSALVTGPISSEDFARLGNGYGVVYMLRAEGMTSTRVGFVSTLSGLMSIVIVMVVWTLTRVVQENLSALNVRHALGYSNGKLLAEIGALALLVWTIPAGLAFVPAAYLAQYPIPWWLILAVMGVPAVLLTVLVWKLVVSGGVKSAAWARR